MSEKHLKSALISVFSKEGLEPVIRKLHELGVTLYSTGGTFTYIMDLGIPVIAVEALTSYPSILDGRVKTLHPKVFGGILARREAGHLEELRRFDIPEIDLVIVDLYPFEETLAHTDVETAIIEKIDIGGISLIRAAAKNYRDVWVVASRDQYSALLELLEEKQGQSSLADRKHFAAHAFHVSSHYDTKIFEYFQSTDEQATDPGLKISEHRASELRYGENPHQQARFFGDWSPLLQQLCGKELSYNNLIDVDAAIGLMAEFADAAPTFAILKHTNPCGLATRSSVLEAWTAALAGDPVSAFGGILISNRIIDLETARAIDQIFYEVLIAPGFDPDAQAFLQQKKNRILLKLSAFELPSMQYRTLLNGFIGQDRDHRQESMHDLRVVTELEPDEAIVDDLLFANICAKHLKSNAIALVKDRQLIGIGCGQTSRVDATRQAVEKAKSFGFDLEGAVLASDAFFPFPDSIDVAQRAGVRAFIQPGGSVKDQECIDFCNSNQLAMVVTGVRHFKH
ncbi:MAG: bifunctional phosphoribosylaminoimidazolecarboxamide formyltransferase/IMP cyclohydrolase [Saprospiraceae bacterium]|jgi:phosphoribosylaminoimidazolecarboxamide formyltransferase / IMP cyclohydrolase|nr:bifunctional phosphoribosylaminoimidazolecarboxamide formyltransferase/IMP cyclohydrolase [Saprospiraceae bacterium]MDP4822023.1 bifunctional phosphoribosylaminoimidazolecarboxamide formyltransferase/IMP cyclohydrolase [Saprospiraceae bacterium]MDP4998389.1 bifunctional phosphoribosylaminoimidazolecarboxamide formyltransferase/IMP cyclohydrolase [Saprospiraceae bacterium]